MAVTPLGVMHVPKNEFTCNNHPGMLLVTHSSALAGITIESIGGDTGRPAVAGVAVTHRQGLKFPSGETIYRDIYLRDRPGDP